MKRAFILLAVVAALCGGLALAQTYLNTVQTADFKNNGTALHFFTASGPKANYINIKTGASIAGGALNIGTQGAIQNTDLGFVVEPGGYQMGKSGSKPTCDAAHRGLFYTQQNAGTNDGGDYTWQCMQKHDGTYNWVQFAVGG